MTPAIVQSFVVEDHAPESTLYLLLDPLADCATDDPLHIEALRQTLGDDALTRVWRPDLEHTPHACPVLVTLASAGARPSAHLLSLSAQRANEDARHSRRYVCGWLSSSANAAAISAHLIALGQLPMAQGKQFFAVYEPLRLELLSGTLRHEEQGYWWPVEHWLFPVASGASSVLSGHPHASVVPHQFSGEVQQDVTLVSSLLATWRCALSLPLTIAPARWTGVTTLPPQAAAKAHYQIRQARQLGLKSQHDIVTLALHCLLLHPRLHEHPHARLIINRAIQEKRSLMTLLPTIDDKFWKKIVSELTHAGARS
ncbi:hypothetical protein [Pseudomonas sp. LF19]|uniref:hypothetical protein n=1 Tax=Pseudomonas sp. LF19 TaxID=2899115 RepID=UPI001F45E869|nr:hypothetical protein [Pseudomonas sp. LF19]MCE5985390.1 hypothetical protein [Pseudomonas sp. LF19]